MGSQSDVLKRSSDNPSTVHAFWAIFGFEKRAFPARMPVAQLDKALDSGCGRIAKWSRSGLPLISIPVPGMIQKIKIQAF